MTLVDDGSVRLYRLPDAKVVKAIRGLGETVSGVVFGSVESGSVFVAAGHSVCAKKWSNVCTNPMAYILRYSAFL